MIRHDQIESFRKEGGALVVMITPGVMVGGEFTFCENLHWLLAGKMSPRLVKLNKSTEEILRMAPGGITPYQNMTMRCVATFAKAGIPVYIVMNRTMYKAHGKEVLGLLKYLNVRLFCLTPQDITELDKLGSVPAPVRNRVITISRPTQLMFPGSIRVRVPYTPHGVRVGRKTRMAVCPAVIDWHSHANMILKANTLVMNHELRIPFIGRTNSKYVRTNLLPHDPIAENLIHQRGYTDRFGRLLDAHLSVDVSVLPADGGRVRYTHLEAWSDGAVPVINRLWMQLNLDKELVPFDGQNVDVANCYAVSNSRELADVVKTAAHAIGSGPYLLHENMVRNGRRVVEAYDPKNWSEEELLKLGIKQ